MSFSFHTTYDSAEFKYDEQRIMYWNINNKSFNDDLYNLYDFELFITRVKNDIECNFFKKNEVIFKYINNCLIIFPNKLSVIINENNRKELINILEQIYNWIQSSIIHTALIENNL
jgi:hypothetical protein